MLISPTKRIIHQTDLADGLTTVSAETDVSTPLLKCLVCFPTVATDRTINVRDVFVSTPGYFVQAY